MFVIHDQKFGCCPQNPLGLPRDIAERERLRYSIVGHNAERSITRASDHIPSAAAAIAKKLIARKATINLVRTLDQKLRNAPEPYMRSEGVIARR